MSNKDDLNLIKLRSVSNEAELSMIKVLLTDNNIPYIIKNDGPGGHMRIITGGSIFGTDIMVSEDDFEKSYELLKSIMID